MPPDVCAPLRPRPSDADAFVREDDECAGQIVERMLVEEMPEHIDGAVRALVGDAQKDDAVM